MSFLFFHHLKSVRLQPVRTAITLLSLMLGMLSSGELLAVRNGYYEDQSATVMREVSDSLETVRHRVNNHETEIRMYDEKMKNFENIIDSLRDQVNQSKAVYKDQLKGSVGLFDGKIAALETTSKGLVADFRQFKIHANESTTALTQYKSKILELEAMLEAQNQNIDHLQAAIRALMDAIALKESAATTANASSGDYQVKAGDSLEKIARYNQTSVQTIKELNGLSHDRIIIGQVLKLP